MLQKTGKETEKMIKINLQLFGGRGAGSGGKRLPTVKPGGGGGNGNGKWSNTPNVGQPDTLKEALGTKGKPMSVYEAVRGANPYYDGSYKEFSENCQRAVIATEARMRGYNVTAQPTYKGDKLPNTAYVNPKTGVSSAFWQGAFKGAKQEKTPTQASVESKMKEYGNGSRGILQVQWKGGGGHALNVVNKGGKIQYIDGQIGAKYNGKELFSKIKSSRTQLTRTDNLKFSDRAKKSVEVAGSRTNSKKVVAL